MDGELDAEVGSQQQRESISRGVRRQRLGYIYIGWAAAGEIQPRRERDSHGAGGSSAASAQGEWPRQ